MKPKYASFDKVYVLKQWHVLFVLHYLSGIEAVEVICLSLYQFKSHVFLFSYHNLSDALTINFIPYQVINIFVLKQNSIYKIISCYKTTAYT